MKVIAITAYNRPTLLYSCLKNISEINRLEEWQTYISIDPSEITAEIVSVIESFASSDFKISFVINSSKMGVRRNPYKLLQKCFGDQAELVLYLEDDVIVSNDCLQVAESISCITNFSNDYLCANLLTTTCNSRAVLNFDPECYPKVSGFFFESKFFSSLGIILNRHQFIKHFEPNWFNYPVKLKNFQGEETNGWDLAINDYLLSTDKLFVIQSLVPRISHQGTHGTHADLDFHNSAYSHIEVYKAPQSISNINIHPMIIQRSNVAALQNFRLDYIKSYLNMIYEFTDLQLYNVDMQERLSKEFVEIENMQFHMTELILLKEKLVNMESRINKKSVRLAEKLASILNRLIGRSCS